MACKQPAPAMAHRKRPGTSGSSCSMVELPVRPPCPATYPPEQHGQEHEEGPGEEEEEEVHYCRQQGLEPELTHSRPDTPTTPEPEHEHEHSHDHDDPDCHGHDDHSHSDDHAECHGHDREHADCHDHGQSHDVVGCHDHVHVHSHINDHDHTGCHGHRHDHADSLDGDSSSDYVNNTSEEEDYDEGLPEEDEGITYYIRYCPEDDSYLEGSIDCNEAEANYTASTVQHVRAEPPGDTDECQEAVEEWVEGEGGVEVGEVRCEVVEQDPDEQIYDVLDRHPHPAAVLHESPPPTEEEEEMRAGVAYAGDYYGPEEDNGNSVVHELRSPYRGRKVVVEGETGEEAEEDIDQIVAEIKMSMSMGSLSSGGTDQSPDELVQDSVPSDYHPPEAHAKPEPAPYTPTPHRHDSRPKSLNLPSTRHNNPELKRGFKVRSRTPEERQQWAQEQMTNGVEHPRKQQRSDLNVPLENNNVPEETKKAASFPSFVDVPGPCEPEDLIDGIIFAANYLGSTQLLSERNPSKNIRMMQAQEAVSRVKSPEGDAQTLTEVDLFISTLRIKVLNADTQETMMDNALRTISYIADIGNIVVLMARRRMPRTASQDCIETTPGAPEAKKQYRMICHVFESEDAQLIAQSIGQSFSVAYQEFLRANGINPEDLSQKEYSDIINTQEMYNDDLIHFSNSENCKELQLEKHKGEILGVVIVESGWGSILPTVILANMMNGGPAARSGKLSIGDQIMSINNTSLVGLPLATCQGIIKGLKNQVQVKLNIVSCPPVTTVLIKRPDLKYQLGFSVQNGIICSLMRGGIAERGGVRVGHRIIEINGQSVVATAHEKIVQALSNSVGEIHMKTMPAAMFRLLTGQETPMYI
ncbi:amyloid-beta A4 precursor protein-binding family A member 2 isoform X2 [Salvelinus fontinalis]|uniref:amyloid-beta A4 precursor protein-binding family A member 2 isoform X2 n=1 Tax=Salvelinus fontinalis TaxID=8038 RepID=UPI0024867D4C|nr:amyloid-beta A4 precursor protein-binding family A member 2 isoform X2 [Salvelinus fontinalis]